MTITKRYLTGAVLIGTVVAAVIGGYFVFSVTTAKIEPYVIARDYDQIVAFANRHRYLMTSTPGYSFEHVFSHNSPNRNPVNDGLLTTKVIRDGNKVVGFTSYYMKTPTVGLVLFMGVFEDYRSKGYGEKLLKHAVKNLIEMGAKRIEIITRPTNYAALKTYSRVGFVEEWRDETFVHMAYQF